MQLSMASGVLWIAMVLPVNGVLACTNDEDCSLNGVCMSSGACECDAGWLGADCGVLDLEPASIGKGYNLTAASPPTSSWGANIIPDPKNSTIWHMFVSEFANHCDISHWSPNSVIVHAVSRNGPAGPYHRQGVVVEAFAHNPKVVQAPDGTWLMYTIGTPVPAEKLADCTRREVGSPGRTPMNLESNVTLFTSNSLDGPWNRQGIVLGPNEEGTWDEDTSNPSPWVFSNGSALIMYRGCVVDPSCTSPICGCTQEYLGVAAADHWKGPYRRLSKKPILPDVPAEDPSLWVDKRGNFHMLMHYIPDSKLVSRHAFARNILGPWKMHVHSIPYTTTVQFEQGFSVTYHKRERPHIVFGADKLPHYFVTGVVNPGNVHGYSGASSTLVQPIRHDRKPAIIV